jgi:hypothetical protein
MPDILLVILGVAVLVLVLLIARLAVQATAVRKLPEDLARVLEERHRAMLTDLHGGLAQQSDRLTSRLSEELNQTRETLHRLQLSLAGNLGETTEKLGITGLAPGPDGELYIASPSAVTKLKMDGTFAIIAQPIELKDCDVDYPDNNPQNPLPSLRGLAVDVDGTVFAAGVGCHAVVKITPRGKIETVLKAERPWSPTGVAVHQGDVYVLEYTNANGSSREGWRPRVRKLAREGRVTTLVTVAAEQ